jgi:hypothetical protein
MSALCRAEFTDKSGELHEIEIEASSVFDAAPKAMHKWAMLWWFGCSTYERTLFAGKITAQQIPPSAWPVHLKRKGLARDSFILLWHRTETHDDPERNEERHTVRQNPERQKVRLSTSRKQGTP